jgi:hypothetical protein
MFGLEKEIPVSTLRWLTNFMATLALVYLYFMIVEELTASYAGPTADRHIAHEVVAGHFAPLFWITVVCLAITFLVPFFMRLRRTVSIRAMVFVAVCANVAALLKRFLIVVPSQTHGALIPIEHGVYRPTIIEYGIGLGLFGLVALAILLFGRLFPLVPSSVTVGDPEASGADTRKGRVARSTTTGLVAMAAVAMILVGLADSFRLFSHGELDPRIPYSPVLFAGGVMLLFCSAIAYETIPRVQRPPSGADFTEEAD